MSVVAVRGSQHHGHVPSPWFDRLDRLTELERDVLLADALLGGADAVPLHEVLGTPAEAVQEALTTAGRLGLLRARPVPGEPLTLPYVTGLVLAAASEPQQLAMYACVVRALRSRPATPPAGAPVTGPAAVPVAGRTGRRPMLTRRQRRVLRGIADGAGNAKLARELSVSVATVQRDTAVIYRELGAAGRAEAVAEGFRTGLLTGP